MDEGKVEINLKSQNVRNIKMQITTFLRMEIYEKISNSSYNVKYCNFEHLVHMLMMMIS